MSDGPCGSASRHLFVQHWFHYRRPWRSVEILSLLGRQRLFQARAILFWNAVLFWNVQGRHDRRGLSRHVGRFDWRLGGVHLSTTIRPQRRCSTRRDGRSRWNFQSIFTQPYMSGILPPMRPRAPKKNNAFKWYIYIYITLEAQAVRPYSPRRQGSEDQSPDLVHATTAAHAAALQATSRRNKLELPFITIR